LDEILLEIKIVRKKEKKSKEFKDG
jgi:hypothetical protein